MGSEFERNLNFSGTGMRLESPTFATINSCLIEYANPRALCDRHRCDAPGFSVDVANEQAFAFRSPAVRQRRIFWAWCVDRHAFWFFTQG